MHHRYDELAWPEVNDAVAEGRIPILPVGSVEQHGPHLPLKTDWHLSSCIAEEAAKRCPDLLLAMPPVPYGIVPHVMDFPGSVTIGWVTFVNYCFDILHGLAYHGFKKMIVLNGHGSNKHLLDQVTRRVILETDAVCALANWWDLLRVAPDFQSRWRNEILPGGGGHAGELETAVYLYLEPQAVRGERIVDPSGPGPRNPYTSSDVFGFGSSPVTIPGFHSQGEGVSGLPSSATAEKGKLIFEEAVNRLVEFAQEFAAKPSRPRQDFHEAPPTIPPPL
jgi:creatinine amidohydrolase